MIPDSNSGSYSSGGNINFDCGTLSGSGRFIDFGSSYLTIPLVLHANAIGAGATDGFLANSLENVYALSMKNIPSLFHSMQVSLSSCECVQNSSFSNLDINYKLLTTSSEDVAKTYLKSFLFAKDSVAGYGVETQPGNVGTPIECNNQIAGQVFTPSDGFGNGFFNQNTGRLERMQTTSFSPAQFPNSVAQDGTGNPTYAGMLGKSFVSQPDNQNIYYFILATVKLSMLHDFFDKLPLMKSPVLRINLSLNAQCRFTSTLTRGAANAANLYPWTFANSTAVTANGVLPFQVSPLSYTSNGTGGTAGAVVISRGFAPANQATVALTVTLGIGRSLNNAVAHPTQQQLRLYIAQRQMSPIYEELYFSTFPSKLVQYEDRTSAVVIPNVAAGQSVIQLIQNGMSRLRRLLIFPKLTTGSTVCGAAVAALDTWQSPFTSSPSTTAPHCWVNNFNVIVSGVNLYKEPIYYGWQHFLNEVKQTGNINGGSDLRMQCGLISQEDWTNGYGFLVADLSAMCVDQAGDDVSRSIQIQLQNASNLTLDYYCVLIFEKQLTINTQIGTLEQ